MSIFKKINKLFASMGSQKAMEQLEEDTNLEKTKELIAGEKIAESKEGQLWVGFQELTGYYFLEATIVSLINIKTFDGGTLIFKSKKGDFELTSDTKEIKSEFSNQLNRFVSQISFNITKSEIDTLVKGKFTEVEFNFKKKSITFNRVV